MIFSKKDFIFSIITGLIAGTILWKITVFLNVSTFWGFSFGWLILLVPILWILGVNLGYFLGRWMPFFNQFGKFSVIGFTNAMVDFGVLNYLIAASEISSGIFYSVFKSVSFIVAMVHSYFWNKHWSFEAGESGNGKTEFAKFGAVSIISFVINVGVASIVVNWISPVLGFTSNEWANIGAVVGAAIALTFSFIGFKVMVFKK